MFFWLGCSDLLNTRPVITPCTDSIREAAKEKSSFLSGRATQRGGGLTGVSLRKKELFYYARKKAPMATKPRGGAKGLSGRTTKKITFLRPP